MNNIVSQQWINYLNELCSADQEAIKTLIEKRVPCKESVPFVIVNDAGEVGLLGIINGFLDSIGQKRIAVSTPITYIDININNKDSVTFDDNSEKNIKFVLYSEEDI